MKSFFFRLKKVKIVAVFKTLLEVEGIMTVGSMNIFPEAQKDVVKQITLNTAFYSVCFYIKTYFLECYNCRIKSILGESILNKAVYNEYYFLNYKPGSSFTQEFSSILGWTGISNIYITNLA